MYSMQSQPERHFVDGEKPLHQTCMVNDYHNNNENYEKFKYFRVFRQTKAYAGAATMHTYTPINTLYARKTEHKKNLCAER